MVEFGLVAFVAALAVSAALTPLARRVALAADLVAAVRPDRLHREARPYGGGLAIADTLLLVVGGAWLLASWMPADRLPGWLPGGAHEALVARGPLLVRLGVGALVFFIIGLVDDRYRLAAAAKLMLQLAAAALVVVGLGIRATVWLTVPGAAEAASLLWIVAVVNAYNMLDHADGLAAAVALVALVALAAGQMLVGQWFVPGLALAAAGAMGGFLVHNFPPAKLFMGDAGSHLVGYLLAVLTMAAQYYFPEGGTSPLVVFVPLAILAVPLFDMVCVVVSRVAQGACPVTGDATSHLGHRMLARGAGPRAVVEFAAGLAAVTGGASVLMYRLTGVPLAGAWGLVGAALLTHLLARRRPRAEETP